MFRNQNFLLTCLVMAAGDVCFGWSDHHVLTTKSLQGSVSSTDKVNYDTLESFLEKWDASCNAQESSMRDGTCHDPQLTEWHNELKKNDVDLSFIPTTSERLGRALRIKVRTPLFQNKLEESVGKSLPTLQILSIYSDEPDWGMDQELFDEYPELWTDDLAFMGGKVGLASQAFRHMYWPEWTGKLPVVSLHLPLSRFRESMGFADQRYRVFKTLSKIAHHVGSPYWGLRFQAFAFHYYQDVLTPFHSVQVPDWAWMTWPLVMRSRSAGLKGFVSDMTSIVSFWHLLFEDHVRFQVKSAEHDSALVRSRLACLLESFEEKSCFSQDEGVHDKQFSPVRSAALFSRTEAFAISKNLQKAFQMPEGKFSSWIYNEGPNPPQVRDREAARQLGESVDYLLSF
ncbi:MAG: hypothetical protein COT74_12785 [Bdellovibrionales bacterium CG10_big_fil_rev_8_21_14_0_10_45_34]|nr:MAG: hypothetical protein COT74_12785 [Bdellovibrionales bacterium CG10_big_fil_rev_8_21_14_0_10_45_34]